jgi:hypothetical protein
MRRVVQGIVAEEVARAGWAPRGAGGAPPSHRVAAAGGALERASGAGRPGEASGVGGAGGRLCAIGLLLPPPLAIPGAPSLLQNPGRDSRRLLRAENRPKHSKFLVHVHLPVTAAHSLTSRVLAIIPLKLLATDIVICFQSMLKQCTIGFTKNNNNVLIQYHIQILEHHRLRSSTVFGSYILTLRNC